MLSEKEMDGKTAAIQWPHDGVLTFGGQKPATIGLLVFYLTRNDTPGPGLIEL